MPNVPLNTRFIGIAPTVNLTERKSALINAETAPYTMQDIVDTAGVSYLSYVALISQQSTFNPDAIELQKDFDTDIDYSRNQAGEYSIDSTEPIFFENKTWAVANTPAFGVIMQIGRVNDNQCIIYCWSEGGGLVDLNSGVYETSIEIRVYP